MSRQLSIVWLVALSVSPENALSLTIAKEQFVAIKGHLLVEDRLSAEEPVILAFGANVMT